MSYLLLKHLHMGLAALSVTLFGLRALLAWRQAAWRQRWTPLRWLPHVVDSGLLLAGLTLMVLSRQFPGPAAPWLVPKLLLLVAYILLGRQALRPGLAPGVRLGWTAASATAVGAIVALAMLKPPL
ncbi:SirB2 family protein [Ideonella livida]|uniref:SirB2 family protein n=1 Tax=Ideonella livida TaxID=2707176 RepID=A0A7C9PIR5_9BURK|nr:SirB2 family protein [Ideonella livida]NDY93037.1 SirB2 family protein [Ideonella livida]